MKAIVNRLLNVRTRVPQILPDNNPGNRFFRPGDVVEIIETVPGDEYKRNKVWYKLADGAFIWSGGVDVAAATSQPAVTASQAKWSWGHDRYDLPFIWRDLGTRGKGVTVAVIDTGVDAQHPDLKPNIRHQLSRNFVGAEGDITDSAGHGTQMAGIIAGAGVEKVFGVAPEANLVVVKASEFGDGKLPGFINGMEYLAGLDEVDIISFSYAFVSSAEDDERLQELRKLQEGVEACLLKNKIVVASIGDNHRAQLDQDLKPDRDTFPACFSIDGTQKNNFLRVGAFDRNNQVCSFSNRSKFLNFLAPGDNEILTTALNGSSGPGGKTSIAAAFTAGCLALLVAYNKIHPVRVSPASAILESCDDVGPQIRFDLQSGNGLMNLRNAIAKLKNI